MKRFIIFVIAICAMIFSVSCGANQPAANSPKNTNTANSNSANNSTATAPAKGDFYSSVYALKGNRMPDDAKLAEQKRDFRNALHINLKKSAGGSDFNWDEKFKDPVNLKLEAGESVLIITFASAEEKKLEKGVYEATEETDAVEKAAKDKNLAIITLIDSTGAKRLKGKITVGNAGDIIMYSFDEKPNAPNLDSMNYGAPFKN